MAVIRPMVEEDLDRVMKLEQLIFPNPWRRLFFLSDIHRPDCLCCVAEENQEVVGYLVAWGRDEVHLANLAVAPEKRNQGIGHLLMERLFQFSKEQGAASIYLEVRKSNAVARHFYSRLGFVPTYIRKGYYENGEDAVIMELALGH
ncbi:MAG: ribosomal protein S18-alanine N-acetyltransferase [candidate division WOR-3 bacterium]